jgi:TIR domain
VADVFISYSHQDRTLAAAISVALEENGISCWFDNSLKAGTEFRNEITHQLDAARAVIVIWSKVAIESLWVKSEASRALDQQKLIPVFASNDMSHQELPLPFAELHTIAAINMNTDQFKESAEFVASMFEADSIRMSPTEILSWVSRPLIPHIINKELITRTKLTIGSRNIVGEIAERNAPFKHIFARELLAWPSIIGAAITIAASAEPLLRISAWAQYLVTQWRNLYLTAWSQLFHLANIDITHLSATVLTCTLFFALIAAASSEFMLSRLGYVAPALKIRWEDYGGIRGCGPALARWDTPTPYLIGAIYIMFLSKHIFESGPLKPIDWISLILLVVFFSATLRVRIYPEIYKARLWRAVSLACLILSVGMLHAYLLEPRAPI